MVLAKTLSKPMVPDFFNIYNSVRAYIRNSMIPSGHSLDDLRQRKHIIEIFRISAIL